LALPPQSTENFVLAIGTTKDSTERLAIFSLIYTLATQESDLLMASVVASESNWGSDSIDEIISLIYI